MFFTSVCTGRVAQDLLVDDALDLELLLARHGAEVDEVEAQPIGRNQRARLLDVLAEHLSKRGMEQVSRGVVAAGRVPERSADFGASPGLARDSSPLVTWTPCRRGQFPARTTPVTRASPCGPAMVPASET